MTTAETITVCQVMQLKREAKEAHDQAMVDTCNLALAGNNQCLQQCVDRINAAELANDGEDKT